MDNMPKIALGLATPWQASAPKVLPNTAITDASQILHRVLKILWLFHVHSPQRRKRSMKLNYVLAAALIVSFAGAAVAEQNQFFIVQDKDKNCRIIEGKPDVVEDQTMKVGKQSYPTREEAEVDIKVVCVKP
jgi:hypothetical protein